MMIDKFVLISLFLQNDHIREKLIPHQRLLAIQEELVGFLLKDVIDDKHGRFNVNRWP
jgi:hypothetical protein